MTFIAMHNSSNQVAKALYVFLLFAFLTIINNQQYIKALRIKIPIGEERCISEPVNSGVLMISEFGVSPGNTRIQAYIQDPNSKTVYSKSFSSSPALVTKDNNKPVIDISKMAHTSAIQGEHRFCFYNNEAGVIQYIDYTIRTGKNAENDYSNIAKLEKLKPVEVELKKVEDTVGEIFTSMKMLREKEKRMKEQNDSLGKRVLTMSIISFTLLVTAKAAEIFYLRRYFASKRLI